MNARTGLFLSLSLLSAAVLHANGRTTTIARAEFTREPEAANWKSWSPRDEISPAFAFDPKGGRDGGGALRISTDAVSDFGAWRTTFAGITPGRYYRFTAWYRARGVENERHSIIARIHWLDAKGAPLRPAARPPEYALDVAREKEWVKIETQLQAPETAVSMDVQLSLGFDANATVWWDDVELAEVESPRLRVVRAMTVHFRPRNSPSAEANVKMYMDLVRKSADQKADIICFPEGMTVVGTGKKYFDVGESIPGPTTESLGQLARELNAYIVAGIYERVPPALYNTAVLIDRQGRVAGRYRKTHLPREEWEAGIAPGNGYPVFDTDFGRIGLMVCWDVQFPEPWRELALQGAEVFLLPIWGGNETLLRARAIENHAFVIASSYSPISYIVAPDGTTLAHGTEASPVVTAELHLDQKIYQEWIGDMSTRTWKERRPDLLQRAAATRVEKADSVTLGPR